MHADAGPARRLLTSRAGWAAAGFLAGVVFWHFVGFWHFVTDVILTREPATASRVAPDKLASDGKPRTTLLGTMPPSRVAVADTCSSLRLDRTTGRTSLDACAAGLRLAAAAENADAVPAAPRADRESLSSPGASVAGWSASVTPSTTPLPRSAEAN